MINMNNTQVNCNMLLFVLGSVCIVTGWSIHSHPHTRWYSQSQTFHIFLSYIHVYLSKAEYVSQSNLHVYNTQIMPVLIVGELASILSNGRYYFCVWGNIFSSIMHHLVTVICKCTVVDLAGWTHVTPWLHTYLSLHLGLLLFLNLSPY